MNYSYIRGLITNSKLMKYIATLYIWLVGGIFYLFIAFFIILIHRFVKIEFLYNFLRTSSRIVLNILFVRTRVIYEQALDLNKTYIFMPNHVSLIDVLITTAYFPVNMNAIEAHTHFNWFIYGKIIKIFGQIPINRHNARQSIKSFEIAKERIKQGRSIIVFPEGTRSKTEQMNPFKTLPFKFAKNTDAILVPVALIGLERMSPERHFWIKPAKAKIVFGKQITKDQMKNYTAKELAELVRTEIIRMHEQYT